MSSPEDVGILESSGNVFLDLEVADPEDALVKAQLARAISTIVAQRNLSQTQAAKLLGIDQPKVSALTRGRLTGFSIDRLLRFLLALDRDVEIVITPKPGSRERAQVSIVAGE
jgi:predicted XRE-type DNA-binding protein